MLKFQTLSLSVLAMLLQKNAELLTPENAVVLSDDRAFLYGDGCFTTARLTSGKIDCWARHAARLQHAIAGLFLVVEWQDLTAQLQQFLHHIEKTGHDDGILKILISRGSSPRGYAVPHHTADVYYYFYPQQFDAAPRVLGTVGIIPELLNDDFAPLRGIKTLNRLPQIWLKHFADAQHWDDALCLNRREELVESIAANIFVKIAGVWQTPNLALNGIDGIMRQEILARMQQQGVSCQVAKITLADLAYAEAAFLCNALSPMQILSSIIIPSPRALQKNAVPSAEIAFNQVECRQLFLQLGLMSSIL